MGAAVWLDSRETAGGRKQSASARAGFDPSRPLPSPLFPTRLQEEQQLGSKVWEGYGEGQGRTSLNPGRRCEPRVGEGTSRDKPDWGAILPLAAGETEAQKGSNIQTGKRVRQGCILSPCLYNLYAEYILRNAGLEEAQAGIKITGRNINNLSYIPE